MSNKDTLEKVVRTTEIGAGGGGLLNPEQANRFIDYMWDATTLGSDVRRVRMNADTMDIDKVHVGERVARLATEATDDHENAAVTFSKISLTTSKIRLDWELTTEGLEDNIEGDDLEDHIARLMATQLANDLEDLAINGDTASSDSLLKSFDGWKKRVEAAAHVVDAQESLIERKHFNAALKRLPRRYKQRRNQLRFYTGSNLVQDYLESLSRESNLEQIATGVIQGSPHAPQGGQPGRVYALAYGVPVYEVPLFDEAQMSNSTETGDIWLSFPNNLLWGVKREIKVYREFVPKKDTIEYTVYTRVGTQVENTDAFVVVNNVAIDTSGTSFAGS